MQVLILSDGIPGHFNQSKGVAALLAETMEINESLAIINPKIRLLRSPIKLIARYLTKNLSTLKAKIIISLFQPIDLQKIDLIIAAGGNTAALSAAIWAAKGVLFLEPLKPDPPDVAQQIVLPCLSVIVTIVLLNDECICATPSVTIFLFFFPFTAISNLSLAF